MLQWAIWYVCFHHLVTLVCECHNREWLAEKDGDALGLLKTAHQLITEGHLVCCTLSMKRCLVAAFQQQVFTRHAPGLVRAFQTQLLLSSTP